MTHALNTGGDRGYLRIATEEAFATAEQLDAFLKLVKEGRADKATTSLWGFYGTSPSERTQFIRDRLLDLDDLRIQAMDETGIDVAILSLTSPGGQAFETDEAKTLVRNANDVLKAACERHPSRYVGMVSIVPQDVQWSVEEIARGKNELGFKGVMVNSHTKGHYLDEEQFDPILKACADNNLPLYIHPQSPPDAMIAGMVEAGLDGAIFGFGVETGYHLLRILTTGVFDRYPNLTVCVGHGGEAIPYWLFRMNYMHQAGVRSKRYERLKPLNHDLFHYMRNNVCVTTSGMACPLAIKLCIDQLGEDRVMYAMDYPYEYVADEVRTHDNLDISAEAKKKLMQTNAERVFNL
ncbi:2,3-dihydroxybenzoate decarboxylase [Sphingobium sp. B2D3A]|uniref:amidohydrolase family protein n=1 Tax=unclassified Sphingobium TaxID=2611147 RepID=UPI0022258904|nr:MULTISPECIES: amidohydrolase family protein [unclassified Sphingobium]MCW2338365.1 2,3-dihydroxybenzoate decarboxylase [Sphingobium sp. B2D3A]MCW2350164.1 2,3-dihydroxybenzoate decarboxylase [Sphingobium sp. B12D2B]MCW2369268.1 2,3-dihydroxybenzoate decarboxylase [Sphingobium sp. B11D3D]MCW2382030.1 2,3-dihydroxybenzoate decarboxylase [Sphingobium sp. B2D3B]MCW2384823.1 2,3-dihydroxybenzoate decarboxylase [Sphingobium sp. B2D3D]